MDKVRSLPEEDTVDLLDDDNGAWQDVLSDAWLHPFRGTKGDGGVKEQSGPRHCLWPPGNGAASRTTIIFWAALIMATLPLWQVSFLPVGPRGDRPP